MVYLCAHVEQETLGPSPWRPAPIRPALPDACPCVVCLSSSSSHLLVSVHLSHIPPNSIPLSLCCSFFWWWWWWWWWGGGGLIHSLIHNQPVHKLNSVGGKWWKIRWGLKSLTTFLHETEKVVKELFTLFLIVQFIQLHQRERKSVTPEKIARLHTHVFRVLQASGAKRLLGYVPKPATPVWLVHV